MPGASRLHANYKQCMSPGFHSPLSALALTKDWRWRSRFLYRAAQSFQRVLISRPKKRGQTGLAQSANGRSFAYVAIVEDELSGRVELANQCSHLDQIRAVKPNTAGCEECLKLGWWWVHRRMCLVCGHVGCCDSSRGRHATAHFHDTGHPVMKSIEPGEKWGWCYIDEVYLRSASLATVG